MDDLNISGINTNVYRSNIGYVPQEFVFYYGTIKENITFGDNKYSDEDIYKSLEMSGANFVNNLKDQIYTTIGEKGYKLSGGQRQKLSLARALIRNPKILILDEPTSSLDEKNKSLIIENLIKIKESSDITIIMISHDKINLNIDYSLYKIDDKSIYKIK